jgi:hypothetical protein
VLGRHSATLCRRNNRPARLLALPAVNLQITRETCLTWSESNVRPGLAPPPENEKAPSRGLFVFSPSVVEGEIPVRAEQRRSRLRRRDKSAGADLDVAAKRRRPKGEMQDASRQPAIPPFPPDSQAFVESPSRDLRMPYSFWDLRCHFRGLSGPSGGLQTGTGRLQGQSLCGWIWRSGVRPSAS